jgi:hypothetical protein
MIRRLWYRLLRQLRRWIRHTHVYRSARAGVWSDPATWGRTKGYPGDGLHRRDEAIVRHHLLMTDGTSVALCDFALELGGAVELGPSEAVRLLRRVE